MTMLCGTPNLIFLHHCYNNASLNFIYWNLSVKISEVVRMPLSYSENSILHFWLRNQRDFPKYVEVHSGVLQNSKL